MDKWIVEGADSKTGADTSVVIEAETDRDASTLAKQRGIFVSSVRILGLDRKLREMMPPPPSPDIEYLRQIKERLVLCHSSNLG
jgi:hypothetical protein